MKLKLIRLDLKNNSMENQHFKSLLIKTIFSFMASDGHIDDKEIEIAKKLCEDIHLFDSENYKSELDKEARKLESEGKTYINNYLIDLQKEELSEEQQLNIVNFAIKTIEADGEIHYSEVKFFKVIKSKLSISKEAILSHFPDIEDYLEDDIITDKHLSSLLDESFLKLGNLKIELDNE